MRYAGLCCGRGCPQLSPGAGGGLRAAAASTVSRVVGAGSLASGAASPAHHPLAQRDGGGSPVIMRSVRLLAEMAAMEASFPGRSAQPAGRFRIGMLPSPCFTLAFCRRIGEFLQQYPDLELILCSSATTWKILFRRDSTA